MRVQSIAVAICCGLMFAASGLNGQEYKIVTPPAWEDVEGDAATVNFPEGFHFQQLIPASWFESVPVSANVISSVAFRPSEGVTGPLDLPFGHLTAKLSTTDKEPDGLSLTYAENSGADETTVFDGPWSIVSQNTLSANGVTKEFDITFPFRTPFEFDRSANRNLLVDILVQPTADVPVIPDAFTDFVFADVGDLTGIHEVGHNAGPDAGPATAEMGNVTFVGGNILQLTFVPEPPGMSLAFIAIGLAICRLRRAARAGQVA